MAARALHVKAEHISDWTNTGDLTAVEALFASLDTQDADLIVAGAFGHPRLYEGLFGAMCRQGGEHAPHASAVAADPDVALSGGVKGGESRPRFPIALPQRRKRFSLRSVKFELVKDFADAPQDREAKVKGHCRVTFERLMAAVLVAVWAPRHGPRLPSTLPDCGGVTASGVTATCTLGNFFSRKIAQGLDQSSITCLVGDGVWMIT